MGWVAERVRCTSKDMLRRLGETVKSDVEEWRALHPDLAAHVQCGWTGEGEQRRMAVFSTRDAGVTAALRIYWDAVEDEIVLQRVVSVAPIEEEERGTTLKRVLLLPRLASSGECSPTMTDEAKRG